MSTYLISDIPQQYDTFHDIISWINRSRLYLIKQKQKASHFLAMFLLILFSIFITSIGFLVLRIAFKILLWFYIPKIRFDNLTIDLDKDKYVEMRNLYDKIDKDIKILKEMQDFFQKKTKYPFIIKGLMQDFHKIIASILVVHTQLAHILQSLNFPTNISTTPFQAASEAEIWDNRNKAYKYLI